MKARRGWGAEESWGSGRCWGLLPSTMLPLLLSCANSWPRILAFLLLAPLTFIIALQHFPWTIMKVAILDKMLIFLPRGARLWPGCPVPGGGRPVWPSAALERRKSSLLYDRVKVKYLCQHILLLLVTCAFCSHRRQSNPDLTYYYWETHCRQCEWSWF